MSPLIPPEADPFSELGATVPSLEYMARAQERYGDVYRVYIPRQNCYAYVIHHPQAIRRVLISNHRNYKKGAALGRVKILLGEGLMTSEGDTWRRRRSMLQPFFQRTVIGSFAHVLAAGNDRLIARMEDKMARDELIDITAETSELTLRIVLEVLFGRDLERLWDSFLSLMSDPVRDARFAHRFRLLEDSVRGVIRERQERGADDADLLSMFMRAREKTTGSMLSEQELIDEVMTLIVAGHETTASSLNLAWFLMSQHAEVESRVHADIDAGCTEDARSIEDLSRLSYTRRFLAEVLRLYPPGWLLSRRSIEPDSLGDFQLPAGAEVLLPLFLVQRDARFWQDPEVFSPDRFEQPQSDQSAAYLPFAAGPRHCIGEYLALCEMLMHVAMVARVYRLRCVSPPKLELQTEINLRALNPIQMQVVRR
jgi:enediyne biosynthesis protein E7